MSIKPLRVFLPVDYRVETLKSILMSAYAGIINRWAGEIRLSGADPYKYNVYEIPLTDTGCWVIKPRGSERVYHFGRIAIRDGLILMATKCPDRLIRLPVFEERTTEDTDVLVQLGLFGDIVYPWTGE